MTGVFVSYSSHDKEIAVKLANELKKFGSEPFIDYQYLRAGQQYPEQLRDKILACEYFLLLVSPDSVKSKWVRAEVDLAHDLNKHIIPIIVHYTEEFENMFWFIRRVERVDISGWLLDNSKSESILKLLIALNIPEEISDHSNKINIQSVLANQTLKNPHYRTNTSKKRVMSILAAVLGAILLITFIVLQNLYPSTVGNISTLDSTQAAKSTQVSFDATQTAVFRDATIQITQSSYTESTTSLPTSTKSSATLTLPPFSIETPSTQENPDLENTCGGNTSNFKVGDSAIVDFNNGGALRILSSYEGSVRSTLVSAYDGHILDLISGPICSKGIWYWQVFFPRQNVTGWVAEGDSRPFLCPLDTPECR